MGGANDGSEGKAIRRAKKWPGNTAAARKGRGTKQAAAGAGVLGREQLRFLL